MSNVSIPKNLQKVAKVAKQRKWKITTNGGGHLKWRSPSGVVIYTPKTPGGGRSHANSMAKLKKAGLLNGKSAG